MPSGTLIFDVETHDANLLYSMPPEEFVRLIGYKWSGRGPVVLTTDLEELKAQIRKARWIIGHNIHAFDLKAVFGPDSNEPLELTKQGRVFDTWVHAILVHPAPHQYTNRFGKPAFADKPEKMKKWFGLDEQAHQLGVKGKTADLKALAKEFGGFGKIPVDDPRYRKYLVGDVEASEAVAKALIKLGDIDGYAIREQNIAARAAIISSNGMRVDTEKAQARVDHLAARRAEILGQLQEKYNFPSEGDAPWGTLEGKTAILAALADHGIKPNKDWPKTPSWEKRALKKAESLYKAETLREKAQEWREQIASGELTPRSVKAREGWIAKAEAEASELERNPLPAWHGLSLSGETLIELTKGTGAEDIGVALAELKGQRSLAQLALDSTHPDGCVHPDITMLQRSGRWSTTNPGLTIWTSRGEGAVEKEYFLPDNDDEVLLELDYSNADARFVAAMSGDKEYAKRFEPGADGHLINAWAAWGKDVVGTDKNDPVTACYRQKAKPLGHGWSYGGRPKTLSTQAGVPLEDAETFVHGMDTTFHQIVKWQNRSRSFASQRGYVLNEWGRKLWVEKGREFTQAPALLGQNGTREIVCDALLRMPVHVLRRVKAQIHDALLLSVPKKNWEECRDYLVDLMATKFKPRKGGQEIDFPVGADAVAGKNWYEAAH
jgi:DNA polymerase I